MFKFRSNSPAWHLWSCWGADVIDCACSAIVACCSVAFSSSYNCSEIYWQTEILSQMAELNLNCAKKTKIWDFLKISFEMRQKFTENLSLKIPDLSHFGTSRSNYFDMPVYFTERMLGTWEKPRFSCSVISVRIPCLSFVTIL